VNVETCAHLGIHKREDALGPLGRENFYECGTCHAVAQGKAVWDKTKDSGLSGSYRLAMELREARLVMG
jgi:hypothetical protein